MRKNLAKNVQTRYFIIRITKASDLGKNAMQLHIESCKSKPSRLTPDESAVLQLALVQWQIEYDTLVKAFQFANYYETLAFVNASAWISHQQDHHPELVVQYNHCKVIYHTHSINGLSRNDFICAAKLDTLTIPV